MPKSSEVAAELRKLADSLDRHPDTNICAPIMAFRADTREAFQRTAKLLPKPLTKGIDFPNTSYSDFCVTYRNETIHIYAKVPQHTFCKLVAPARAAVYECDPIFSDDEINELIDEAEEE